MRVLVTGGAGFVGSHLVDALVDAHHDVVVLDNLDPSVHPRGMPAYRNPEAEYIQGDVRDRVAVERALTEVEGICHLASLIEVAESVRDPGPYVDVNLRGTAVLLDVAVEREDPVDRLVLASSAAVYGEGAYRCPTCGPVTPEPRREERLRAGTWDPLCPRCGDPLEPRPTSEGRSPHPTSPYGWTKLLQERLVREASTSVGIPAVLLRYANVYGPRQRGGPYAGVVTTFLQRLRRGEPPVIHEDGHQTRDFVHVRDVVQATLQALEAPVEGTLTVNVGTGRPVTVEELAVLLAKVTGSDVHPIQEGSYRPGDVRHLWFDVERAREQLGFRAAVDLRDGLTDLARSFPPPQEG